MTDRRLELVQEAMQILCTLKFEGDIRKVLDFVRTLKHQEGHKPIPNNRRNHCWSRGHCEDCCMSSDDPRAADPNDTCSG